MANWKNIGRAAQAHAWLTAHQLKEKNRRLAAANRLRTVIRCEEKAAEKEYLALGRYYYNARRNSDDPIAESHCVRVDQIQARRDSALEALEQVVQEQNEAEASSIGVIAGSDGPTKVFAARAKKKGTLFRFDKGPVQITVTRDGAGFEPEDADSEEIDLSDVERFDSDPMPETAGFPHELPPAAELELPPAAELELPPAAELDENDCLPFE